MTDEAGLETGTSLTCPFPTVEWVKYPVDRDSAVPSGRPIERRHFADCEHWYRNEDGSLVGGPPHLATDEQMSAIAPCADCVRRARRNGHPEQGTRLEPSPPTRQHWWVSQGYNYDIAIEQQTLWSLPKKGRDLPDRRLLKEMSVGDVVLHYADNYLRAVSVVRSEWRPASRPVGYRMRPGDGDDGWLVDVEVQQTDGASDRRCLVLERLKIGIVEVAWLGAETDRQIQDGAVLCCPVGSHRQHHVCRCPRRERFLPKR